MAQKRQQAQNADKTNPQQVKKQNQAAAQGQQYEFASETNAQEVARKNQQAEAKKGQRQQ